MPLALDFTWTAPDTCPTRAEVVEQLSRAVDSAEKQLPALVARAIVRHDGASWRLELTTQMDGQNGTRLLEADSCEGLARAATLVLALTLGEGLARQQAQARVAAAPPAKKPPARADFAPPPIARRARARFSGWGAIAASRDALGAWGPALALGARYEPRLFAIGASLRANPPRSSKLPDSVGTVRSFSFGAELALCLGGSLRAFQLAACANAGLTWLQAQGHGTARDSRASVPLYGAGPSVAARWLFSEPAFIGLTLDSRFFVQRPWLVVEGLEAQRRIESTSFGAELAGGVRW